MAVLQWDKVGERFYQTGVNKAVLYLHDGTVAVWNGLTSVEDTDNSTLTSYWLDGVKYLDSLAPGDFAGKLKAYTYPDEFDRVNGVGEVAEGLRYYDQPSKSFNLSFQTKLANDLEGTEYGYKIHLLYNLIANPETYAFPSLTGGTNAPIEFAWILSGTPPKISGYRPTAHITIDSNETRPDILQSIEDIIYGTDLTNPRFPSIDEIRNIFQAVGALIIVDNGDGTWQAIDYSGTYITMTDATTFRIDHADAVFLDPYTYNISSTYP